MHSHLISDVKLSYDFSGQAIARPLTSIEGWNKRGV
jgi:hypothetical protein